MTDERPMIEKINVSKLFTAKLCGPIEEAVNKIEVCEPHIEVTKCSPISLIRCLPDLTCWPYVSCIPDRWCFPYEWCRPWIGPCNPLVEGVCAPSQMIPGKDISEIKIRVEELVKEINILKEKIGSR